MFCTNPSIYKSTVNIEISEQMPYFCTKAVRTMAVFSVVISCSS